MERPDHQIGHRADQRIGRGPDTAGENHREPGRAAAGGPGAFHQVRGPDGVRHDRKPGNLAQVPGQLEGGGPGGERDRGTGRDLGSGCPRDGLLLRPLEHGLGVEAGLVAARHARHHRAAVHLLDQPRPGQHLQVAADRHVRDAEALGKVAYPRAARAPDVLQDQRLPVLGEHLSAFQRREQAGRTTLRLRQSGRQCHMFISGESCSLTRISVCSSLWHHSFAVFCGCKRVSAHTRQASCSGPLTGQEGAVRLRAWARPSTGQLRRRPSLRWIPRRIATRQEVRWP